MRLASTYLLVVAAGAFVPPVQQPVAARTAPLHAREEANVGTAVRNIAPWLIFVLVGTAPRSNHFSHHLNAIELSPSPPVDSTIEPALRIPNYKECVAEKGHEACANLLPFFQWLYEHGIDVAA